MFGLELSSLHISAFSPKVAIPPGVYTNEGTAPVVLIIQRILSQYIVLKNLAVFILLSLMLHFG